MTDEEGTGCTIPTDAEILRTVSGMPRLTDYERERLRELAWDAEAKEQADDDPLEALKEWVKKYVAEQLKRDVNITLPTVVKKTTPNTLPGWPPQPYWLGQNDPCATCAASGGVCMNAACPKRTQITCQDS